MDFWGAIEASSEAASGEGLRCPLCEYDLRGLSEPRCPECGYQFDWVELRDRTRHVHPFLFEHHPERNVWSFARTAIAGLNFFQFWKTIKPHMTPRPMRLRMYWLICTLMPAFFAMVLAVGQRGLEFYYPRSNGLTRAYIANGRLVVPVRQHRPIRLQHFEEMANAWRGLVTVTAVIGGWTACTYFSLLIFQQSMAKAKILTVHVSRCVLYSFDVGLWSTAVIAAWMTWSFSEITQFKAMMLLVLLGLLAVHAMLKLWTAYRYYLRFNHSFLVVFSTQVIAFLALMIVVVNLLNP